MHIRYFIGYVYHICLQDTIQSPLSLCLLCQAMLLPMLLRPLLLTTRSGFSAGWCCVLLPLVAGCSLLGLVARCCFRLACFVAGGPAWSPGLLPCCVPWFVVVPRFRVRVMWCCVVVWCRAVVPCCLFSLAGGVGLCFFPVCAVLCCAVRRVVLCRVGLCCCWCLVLWCVAVCCGVSLGVL